jgi:hypothetical protein
LIILGLLGFARENDRLLAAGTLTLGRATERMLSQGFAALLFATLAGALCVTAEFRHSTIGRSVFLFGGRGRLLMAKIGASIITGVLLGALGALASVVATLVWLDRGGRPMVWTGDAVLTVAGVVIVSALAGPLGVAIGWAVRNQTCAVVGILVWILGVESAFVSLVPSVGKWLPGGAQAAVYRDPTSKHLGMSAGLALLVAWTVTITYAAFHFRRRDDL